MSFNNSNPLRNFKEGEIMYMIKNDLNTHHIDPFNLLEAAPLTTQTLEEKYNKLKILNHPDKGGLEEHFIQICEALKYIKYMRKSVSSDKQFFSLRQNSMEDTINIPNISGNKVYDEYGEFSNSKFNEMFDKYHFKQEDKGYGDIMSNDDSNIPDPEKINFADFHSKFRENKKQHVTEIIEYQVPQPVDNISNQGYILGDNRNNFSGKNYTDYYQAYNQSNLINDDVEIINRDIESYKKQRENPESLHMTSEQAAAVLEDKETQQTNEWERVSKFKDYISDAEEYSRKMKNIYLNN